MNYEFHVGDYVETVGGAIGYISDERNLWWRCICPADGYNLGFDHSISGIDNDDVHKYFLRIGTYDFTKKEKKKIEMISKCNRGIFANTIKPENHLARMVSNEIIDKINELVDAVNKLMDKEDNE